MSRSESGSEYARNRRAAQREAEFSQRYDPDHFKLDTDKRLQLVTPVTDPVPPQAVAFEILADTSLDTSALTKLPIEAASSSTGNYITVDTTSDTVKLQGGSAYIVEVHYQFKNTNTSSAKDATLAVADTNGTVYATQLQSVQDDHVRGDIWLTAVVDRIGASSVFIEVQALAQHSDLQGFKGWAKAHRLT
jgi:hypothetical protein